SGVKPSPRETTFSGRLTGSISRYRHMVGGRPLNESRGKRLRAASRSYSARSGDPQVQRPSTRPFSNTAAQLGHTMRLKKFIAPLPLPVGTKFFALLCVFAS